MNKLGTPVREWQVSNQLVQDLSLGYLTGFITSLIPSHMKKWHLCHEVQGKRRLWMWHWYYYLIWESINLVMKTVKYWELIARHHWECRKCGICYCMNYAYKLFDTYNMMQNTSPTYRCWRRMLLTKYVSGTIEVFLLYQKNLKSVINILKLSQTSSHQHHCCQQVRDLSWIIHGPWALKLK